MGRDIESDDFGDFECIKVGILRNSEDPNEELSRSWADRERSIARFKKMSADRRKANKFWGLRQPPFMTLGMWKRAPQGIHI